MICLLLDFMQCYIALSLLLGIVLTLGFFLDWTFCTGRWWLMAVLVFPLSLVVPVSSLAAYGFYKWRVTEGGAL